MSGVEAAGMSVIIVCVFLGIALVKIAFS